MIDYLIDRLSEASTWRGILAFLTAAGVATSPEQAEAIIAGGLALIGIVGVFTRDKPE
jgi:hypothetical protein